MRKSFVTLDQPDDSPKWQKITISDECDEKKDGCRYSIEISYAKGVPVSDKQTSVRNLIRILNIGRPEALNFEIDFTYLEAVKITGNISEALFTLDANQFIRRGILQQIKVDAEAMSILEESSKYVLPPDVDSGEIKIPTFTQEDLEEFGMDRAHSAPSTPTTPTKKIGFFESGNNSRSDSGTPTNNSEATTPKNTVGTTAGGESKLPPASPTTIKVK